MSVQNRKRTRDMADAEHQDIGSTADQIDDRTIASSSRSSSRGAQRVASTAKRHAYIRIDEPEPEPSTSTAAAAAVAAPLPDTDPTATTENSLSACANATTLRRRRRRRRPAPKPFLCSICLDPPTDMGATTCGHIFCRDCILTALDIKAACPICRRKQKAN